MRTTDVYDNYVFHVEVRFPRNGNSGVLIHVQRDDVWPKGIECQLYQGHTGRIFPIQGATMDGGEMIHSAAKPPGEWNVYEAYSEEGRVATVLNGKLIGLGSNANPRVGHIACNLREFPHNSGTSKSSDTRRLTIYDRKASGARVIRLSFFEASSMEAC